MSMKEIMDQELAEALATLNKANSALARIFNVEEGEYDQTLTMECDYCGSVKGEPCSPKCKREGEE